MLMAAIVTWLLLTNKSGSPKISLENPDQLFNVIAPDDFDANRLERLGEKIAAAKTLYADKPGDTWTWITIGNMYEFVHDYDRAIGAYEKAANLNEAEYISRMNLAYIYQNQKKDYVKAEGYYKKVVELNSANPENYLNLAQLYEFKMNQPDEAEKVYLAGLEKVRGSSDLLVAIISFYQRADNMEKAAEYARQLLKLYPDNELYKKDFGALAK